MIETGHTKMKYEEANRMNTKLPPDFPHRVEKLRKLGHSLEEIGQAFSLSEEEVEKIINQRQQELNVALAPLLNKLGFISPRIHTLKHEAARPIGKSLALDQSNLANRILRQYQKLYEKIKSESVVPPPPTARKLTVKEREVLNYIAKGYRNKQIAATLNIKQQTVKNHILSIMVKLNAKCRTEAVAIAVKKGLISIG